MFEIEWLRKAFPDSDNLDTLDVFLIRLLFAFVMGFVVAGVYRLTVGRTEANGPFTVTLVTLAVLIALVTLVIGSNQARAFSLVGALAIVRFRTVVEDTRDTAFVMFAVVAGMAAGSGYLIAPLACTPLILFAGQVLRQRDTKTTSTGSLVLRLAAGRQPGDEINNVLRAHVANFHLTALSTARGGAALDVTYAIRMPTPDQVFPMIQALNRVEGVQGVEVRGTD